MAAHEIIPRLWLGNRKAALDTEWLGVKGIQCVFNCTKDIPFVPSIQRKYRVPVDDNLEAEEIRNLELWSYEIVYKMSREYKTGQPILVHCAAGMQRSAACVAMFLMATQNITPDQAIQYIRSIRPIAFFPNANFRGALDGFYKAFQRTMAPIPNSVSFIK
uniref:Dual specificity phosphatase catalytic domain n=1 Tax=viral metagenome TaxID=1070528 RepID=A0A6C0KKK0_9ZZZZ